MLPNSHQIRISKIHQYSLSFDKLISASIFAILSFIVSVDAKFLLSCRVISGICHGDGMCFDEMINRFPDCYMDQKKPSINEVPIGRHTYDRNEFQKQQNSPIYLPNSMKSGAIIKTDYYLYNDEPIGINGELFQLNDEHNLSKRSMKLRNILMKVDRIPVG